MAGEHLSEQLRMFMSANEIKREYQPLPGDRNPLKSGGIESADQLYARKAKESKSRGKGVRSGGPSLHETIRTEGVQTPVHLVANPPNPKNIWNKKHADPTMPFVAGGHHRVAVSGETAPDRLMPVMHHADMPDARRGPWTKAYGRKYT